MAPPSPGTQLRAALSTALASGIEKSDNLVERAEGIVTDLDMKIVAVRADLQHAMMEWESCMHSEVGTPGSRGQLSHLRLRPVEDCLIRGLIRARVLGIPEEELRQAELHRRRVHNMIEELKGQVRVFCRVRPLNSKEIHEGDFEAVLIRDHMTIEVPHGVFSFDSVFVPGSQEEVFEDCKDLIQSAVDGHNVTIFAYGQTGAGKTHTMYGTQKEEGIAPRASAEVFQVLEGIRSRYDVTVKASMLELYNNVLVDLLRPIRRNDIRQAPKLNVRYDKGGVVQIDSLVEREAQDAKELKQLLERGLAQRTVAANAMNIESSRSHLIFTIKVTSVNKLTQETLSGKILLCDLGGSERLKKSEAIGSTQKEAIEINRSLTALGDVIEAIARKQKSVPYRNHKLTQIMQDSLGGRAKTLMFVNCSPAWSSINETVMSLMYAARAKRITNSGTPCSSPSVSSPASPATRRGSTTGALNFSPHLP